MGDEEGPAYKLITKENPDGVNTSRGHTGPGQATYPNGDLYDGVYTEGQRNGWGEYTFANGDKFTGVYEANQKHGLGKMTFSSQFAAGDEDGGGEDGGAPPRGGSYHGYFDSGKRGAPEIKPTPPGETSKSEGTFTYHNQDVYIGQWQEGKKHGKGCYTYAGDGSKLTGEWESGKITSGQWIFPNGTFYSGKFRYNKPFGKGVWVFKNGNQMSGNFDQKPITTGEEAEAPPEEEGGAPPKDPEVKCAFKYGDCVMVKGEGVPRPAKLVTQTARAA